MLPPTYIRNRATPLVRRRDPFRRSPRTLSPGPGRRCDESGNVACRWSAPSRRSGSASSTRPRISATACSCRRARRSTPRSPPCRPTWRRRGPPYASGSGAENFWDDVLHGRLRDRTVPRYGSGPAFLFEVHPQFMPAGLENELFQLRVAACSRSWPTPSVTRRSSVTSIWPSASGATPCMMVDLGALDGAHGRAEMKTARKLVQEGLAHAAATGHPSPRRSERDRRRDGVDPQAARRRGAGTDARRRTRAGYSPARCRTPPRERVGAATSAPRGARPLRRSRLP